LSGEPKAMPTRECEPRILIVEDNAAMARSLARIGKLFGSVTVEGTVSGALDQLARRMLWSAFVVDFALPDGSGLDVVSRIRAVDSNVPALILTGHGSHEIVTATLDLRAQYLAKPATRTQLLQFLTSATELPLPPVLSQRRRWICPQGPAGLIAERVEKLAQSCKLTPLEVDLVDACVHGFSRKEYVEAHAISVNTYKTRVRRALRKLGASCLGDVRDGLLKSR